MIKECDECQDLSYCRKLDRCIRRQVPNWEDEEAMREYGEGLRELLRDRNGSDAA